DPAHPERGIRTAVDVVARHRQRAPGTSGDDHLPVRLDGDRLGRIAPRLEINDDPPAAAERRVRVARMDRGRTAHEQAEFQVFNRSGAMRAHRARATCPSIWAGHGQLPRRTPQRDMLSLLGPPDETTAADV